MNHRVAVVGAGVVGLAIAHELAARGDEVTVVAERPALESVSAVAAAMWFPYACGDPALVTPLLARSLERFVQLADVPATAVDLRPGVVVERRPDADRFWTSAVPDHREAWAEELPPGAVAGVRATLPVITMPRYLSWLAARCAALGVRTRTQHVDDVDELADDADLVVVAAGGASGALLGDPSGFPVRGQVVRLANPGLTEWILDDEHPAGMIYVIPRRDDIVVGGTEDVGATDSTLNPQTELAILSRARELVPALADLPIVSRAVGLRPARDAVRLEAVDGFGVPVIACYGHGGSGVTLSWGCAEAVAALAGRLATSGRRTTR